MRTHYMISLEVEEPPLKGTNGDILQVVECAVTLLQEIKGADDGSDETSNKVSATALNTVIALVHCLTKRHEDMGTISVPRTVH